MSSTNGPRRIELDRGRLLLVALVTTVVAACAAAAAPSPSSMAASPTVMPVPSATAATPSAVKASATVSAVKITPIPGASDSGKVVKLVAHGGKWDLKTMTAPAGQIWHVTVESQESIGHHNFVVASGPAFDERMFTSENLLPGTTVTYDIPAFPAGNYLFICTVHPADMTGMLTIR